MFGVSARRQPPLTIVCAWDIWAIPTRFVVVRHDAETLMWRWDGGEDGRSAVWKKSRHRSSEEVSNRWPEQLPVMSLSGSTFVQMLNVSERGIWAACTPISCFTVSPLFAFASLVFRR